MFGSEILEIAISLVFVYLVCSLVATTIREAIEGIIKTRAVQLERGIRLILDDPEGTGYTQKLYNHPFLCNLFLGNYSPGNLTDFRFPWRRDTEGKRQNLRTNLPAYIPSGNFALALMHTVSETVGTEGPLSMQSFTDGAMLLPEGRLKKAMLVAVGEAKGDLDRARKSVETWFDGTMDRVSGWYKRETSYILFAIGLVTAVLLNVDTIAIVRDLASNNTLRQQLVAHVDTAYPGLRLAGGHPTEIDLKNEVTGLSNIVGWAIPMAAHHADLERRAGGSENADQSADGHAKWVTERENSWSEWFWYWPATGLLLVPGWIISALAISLGAPFWFDLLNKLMVIRSTVKPYEKSPPEASADRGASTKTDALAPADAVDRPTGAAAPPPPGSGPTGPVPPTPAAGTTATLRVAVEGADPGTVRVGLMTPVPDTGFVELHVPVGPNRTISAVGTANGQTVSWAETRDVSLDDEQALVAATLT